MTSGHLKNYPRFLLLFLLLSLFGTGAGAREGGYAAVLISEEIRPFIMMVEGLESEIGMPVVRVFMGEKGDISSPSPRFEGFSDPRILVSVAVGPSALSYLTDHPPLSPVLYGMVLNPELMAREGAPPLCGISLNLFSLSQVNIIGKTFPELRRIGVLYDPANNQEWFESATAVALFGRVRLVPLAVSGNADIARLFEGKGPDVDAILFVPDRTVISRTVIRHVIKKALFHGIPAVGYNRFFHESGAALSFVIDYEGVGRQVAKKAEALLAGEACDGRTPSYKVLLNSRVVKLTGVAAAKPLPSLVEVD